MGGGRSTGEPPHPPRRRGPARPRDAPSPSALTEAGAGGVELLRDEAVVAEALQGVPGRDDGHHEQPAAQHAEEPAHPAARPTGGALSSRSPRGPTPPPSRAPIGRRPRATRRESPTHQSAPSLAALGPAPFLQPAVPTAAPAQCGRRAAPAQ